MMRMMMMMMMMMVAPGHGQSWIFRKTTTRPGKSWKLTKVMENVDDDVM